MSVNKVILIGRLGHDPDLRQTGNGRNVCKLSLATTQKYTDQMGQSHEKTEWHAVIVWGKLAGLCNQYLAKGRQCYVEGRLETRQWEDQQGMKRYTTEVIATTVQFLGASPNSQQGQGSTYSGQQRGQQGKQTQRSDYQVNTDANYAGDDIPF